MNVGLELMGARTLQRLAAENDARAHLAESARQFRLTARAPYFLAVLAGVSGLPVRQDLIEKAGAKSPYQLMLTDEKSMWGSDIYIDVAKDVPGATLIK